MTVEKDPVALPTSSTTEHAPLSTILPPQGETPASSASSSSSADDFPMAVSLNESGDDEQATESRVARGETGNV